MATIRSKQERFLSDLLARETSLNGKSNAIKKLRQKGLEDVQKASFPHRKDEGWRFTSLRDLYSDNYTPASQMHPTLPDISAYYIPESDKSRLVFVNGRFSQEHSSVDALPQGVTIGNLADEANAGNEEVGNHLNAVSYTHLTLPTIYSV